VSNIFMTQRTRHKYGVSWEEEFILGLVAYNGSLNVSAVIAASSDVMTQATTHKYLTQLIDKDYLKHDYKIDKRIKMVGLTTKGVKYIKEIAHVSALPSLVLS
jgi:DNA-binding MarR family transcriptional regulator